MTCWFCNSAARAVVPAAYGVVSSGRLFAIWPLSCLQCLVGASGTMYSVGCHDGFMSEATLLQTLLDIYKSRLVRRRLLRPCPISKRRSPVNPSNGILEGLGEYFPLVGFEPVVDDVIRLLCHLCRKFHRGMVAYLR